MIRLPRRIKVASAPLQATPKQPIHQVMHDVDKTTSIAGLIGWTEIEPSSYKAIVRDVGGKWKHFLLETNTPISVDTSIWIPMDSGKALLHEGKVGRNPQRFITWVKVRHRKTNRIFIFNNAHYVADAWNNEATIETEGVWLAGNIVHRKLVRDWVQTGYSVIGVGDYNRMNSNVMGKTSDGKQVTYYFHNGIIYIWSIQAKLRLIKKDSVPLYSDHDAKLLVARI